MQILKNCILPFLIPIFAFSVTFADSIQAQHSIGLNMNFSTTLGNNFYSPDFGTEVELSYQNNLLHVKNDLYLFGRFSAFYQPKAFSTEVIYVTGSAQYDRYRYGGSSAAGFYIAGPVIHTEIGVGISRHFIEYNKIQDGTPPPSGFSPQPDRPSRQFNTFDFNVALAHEFTNSFIARVAFRIQNPLNQQKTYRLSPSMGMMYNF